MIDSLKKAVKDSIVLNNAELIEQLKIHPDQKNSFIEQLTKESYDLILSDVKLSVKEEALKEAQRDYKKWEREQKIKALKKLTGEGILIAFTVGLLINQITEIIAYCKGASPDPNIRCTFIIAILLSIACAFAYSRLFISELDALKKDIVGDEIE